MRRIKILFIVGVIMVLFSACSGKQTELIHNVSDLNKSGYTIGVPEGTPPEEVAKQYLPSAKISYFTQIVDGIAALKSGKVTAVCYDSAAVDRILLNNTDLVKIPEELGEIEIAAVMRKGDTVLAGQINNFIQKLEQDGTLEEMYDRWIENMGGEMPDIPEPEHPGKTLTVITNGLSEPMNFYEAGRLTGYDIELMRRFAAYANIQCEFITMDYAAMISALQSEKGDIIVSDFFKTEEREEEILYSDTYVVLHNSIILQKSRYGDGVATSGEPFLSSLKDSFRKTFLVEDRYQMILQGLRVTVIISVLSALLGSLLGVLICVLRRSRRKLLSGIGIIYIRLIQGVPTVLLLMILYYILFAKVDIDPVLIAVVGFSINFAAYASEIFRTAIEATDKGQLEAAYALGFSKSGGFIKVTLPQALRHILPIYKGEFVSMVKMTSVVGYIAIQDLTKMSDIIRSRTFDAFFPLFATAFVYFVLTYLFIFVMGKIELRLDPKRRRRMIKGIYRSGSEEKEKTYDSNK